MDEARWNVARGMCGFEAVNTAASPDTTSLVERLQTELVLLQRQLELVPALTPERRVAAGRYVATTASSRSFAAKGRARSSRFREDTALAAEHCRERENSRFGAEAGSQSAAAAAATRYAARFTSNSSGFFAA